MWPAHAASPEPHCVSLPSPVSLQPCHTWRPADRACVRRHRAARQPAWPPLLVWLPSSLIHPWQRIVRRRNSKRQQTLAPVSGGCARPGECECELPPWKRLAGMGKPLARVCAAAPFGSLCRLCPATCLAAAAGGQGCWQGGADRVGPAHQLSAGDGAALRFRWPAGGPAADGWSGERHQTFIWHTAYTGLSQLWRTPSLAQRWIGWVNSPRAH
jgi:hypothetical protein